MKWSIKQNEHNKKWYFFVNDLENEHCVFPDYTEISAAAIEKGLPAEDIISVQQFDRYCEKIRYGKTLPLPLELELEPTFDTRLIISADKTKAELYVRKAKDSAASIDKKVITNMLNNSGISNIDYKALQEKISTFAAASDREIELLIAEGTPPERGPNRTLIPHITKLSEEENALLRKKLVHAVEMAREQVQMLYDKDFPLSEAQSLSLVVKDDLLFEFSKSELGKEGVDIYGKPIQGLQGNDPFVSDLRNISQMSDQLKAVCSGILLLAEVEAGLKMRIIPYKDARVTAKISEDKMEAILVMESGKGAGSRLSSSQLKAALDAVKLPAERYTEELLQEAIRAARLSSLPVEYTVCRGISPVAPQSYKFDWKVTFDHSNSASVKRGMLLLETTFLEEGENGVDVFGNIIGIDQAQVIQLPKTDRTITVAKQEGKILFTAVVTGELPKNDDILKIINSKIVTSDINKETGDVIFAGDLVVNGNIEDHRTVKAGGCLTVNGDASVSLVYTKQSLLMNGGIRGENRGTVWAKNSIALQYAEAARLLASGNISIDQYCFRCIVKTNGKLSVMGEPGSFIGGNAHVACGMQVRNLGDYKTIRTIVSFGQDYLIKDKIEVYEKETQENTIELSRIEAELAETGTSNDRIQELREQKVLLMKYNTALGLKIFKLKENFESHIKSEIRITGTAYPGVILESHGRYYEIREPMSHVVFTFDSETGRIICNQIEEDIQEIE